jgi:hypothetical protein
MQVLTHVTGFRAGSLELALLSFERTMTSAGAVLMEEAMHPPAHSINCFVSASFIPKLGSLTKVKPWKTGGDGFWLMLRALRLSNFIPSLA